jgi:hypothetical protein
VALWKAIDSFFLQHRLATQAASDLSEVEFLLIIFYDFNK